MATALGIAGIIVGTLTVTASAYVAVDNIATICEAFSSNGYHLMRDGLYGGNAQLHRAMAIVSTVVMIFGTIASSIKKSAMMAKMQAVLRATDDFPKDRLDLHNQLTERGFTESFISDSGYVRYRNPIDGTNVHIKPSGKVITVRKVWIEGIPKKAPVRYYWNGTPVPNFGHSTR